MAHSERVANRAKAAARQWPFWDVGRWGVWSSDGVTDMAPLFSNRKDIGQFPYVEFPPSLRASLHYEFQIMEAAIRNGADEIGER